MADPNNLDDTYTQSRQATDQWQSQVLADGGVVKLEASIPPAKPNEDMNQGNRRTDEELKAMGLSYDDIGKPRKEFTVESPEVQAIRTTAQEQAAKLGTGELAAEEVGKAGRKLAEALHPGVVVAGRALGLDEAGADALATGFVEFLGGLPGPSEGDAMAGIETALAALPAVGMAIKGGKGAGKHIGSLIAEEFKKAVEKLGVRPLASASGPEIKAGQAGKTAGSTGGANITSAASPPPGTQAVPSNVSTLPVPSGSSTTRSTAPSALTGPATTTGASITTPPLKKIIQPSTNVKDLLSRASEGKPILDAALQEIASQTPGLAIVGTRVKDAARLKEKIKGSGRSPDTISDYLGARISIDTPADMDAAIAALKARYPIVEFEDFRLAPRKGGYRAVHLQAQLPNGLSAEIQLVPKPIADIQEHGHTQFWEKWRNVSTFTPEQMAAFKTDTETWNKNYADAYEQWVEKGTTADKITFANQRFEERLQTFAERLSKQRRGVRSDVQVTADSISPEALTQEAFLDLPPGTILKDSDVVAVKRMFKDLAEPVRLMAQATAADPQNQDLLLSMLKMLPEVDNALTRLAGAYAESGRTQRLLSSARPTGGMVPADSAERIRISDAYIQQWLDFFKQQEALAQIGAPALTPERLAAMLAELKSPEELLSAAKALANPTKWDMFVEYWINGLLSGPQTHATNILSNAATLAWGIPERALASMFSSSVRPSEPVAMLAGILEAQGDAFRLAWKAFKEGESQLGQGKLEGPTRAITAEALNLTGIPGRAVDFLGNVIRLPGRALIASDDYFKSIAFRAELRALAKRTSFSEVTESGLTGQAAKDRMRQIEQRILTSPPPPIDAAAREFAAYTTFTRELGETGQKVQQALSTPIGRIFVPFVRTPTNIFKYFGERTPLAFASQAVRDEIAAGGDRRALALAKISLGAMTMGYMGMLASEGIITGGGPKDKRLRQILMDTGWQPYSIKVGDTYYKYSRIEPLASLIGLAADAADLLGQLPEEEADQLASALVVAISRQVAQKTFVKGLAGTLNAVASQDINEVKSFFEKELPTILPFSSAMGQTARELDPVMREVSSILEAFQAKVPGYSDSLPPRRNLWGEPILLQGGLGPDMITPIYTSERKENPVSEELARLKMPVSMPSKSIDDVPLDDPWEYDAYVVLQGSKPIIGGKTLKEQLAETMATDLYKRSSGGPDGGKSVLIRQWVNSYREQARNILDSSEQSKKYLGRDFPELIMHRTQKRAEAMQQFNAPVEAR